MFMPCKACDTTFASHMVDIGAGFSALVQTGSGAHPAQYRVSFRWIKQSDRGFDHPTPSSAEIKERVELYFCCPSGLSWRVLG
jgi:hypothetical protein